jgi:DNA-binding Lrp family transcriptional regulator
MEVALDEWLALIEDEYLRTFIAEGGAAVKCVVIEGPEAAMAARHRIEELARGYGLTACFVDAATTRVHMIEQLFHQVARQIDWDDLVATYMRRLLQADGFVLPEDPGELTYPRIAEINATDEPEVRRRVRALLRDHVSRDYAMTREFRTAMLRLCQARLETGAGEQEEAGAIKAWLRGELRLISALKFARIFQKVGRNNARDLFLSLTHWLPLVGRRGLALTLDISRYLANRRGLEQDGGLFYSLSATLDAYEVIRQFIDATDEMEACLITILAPSAFLADDKRGLVRYDALKLRLWDDVHDRYRPNPLAGLLRLRVEGEQIARVDQRELAAAMASVDEDGAGALGQQQPEGASGWRR